MKKYLLIALQVFLLSCGNIQEKKNELTTSALENLVEKATGRKYDAADVNNADKNSASVNFTTDELNLSQQYQKGFGSITASKETIVITVNVGENNQNNLLIGFTGKDLTQNHPINGKLNNSNGNSMSFSTMNYANDAMEAMISFELEGEMVEFKEEKAVIRLKGKLGRTLDAENPEKWKAFEGTVTLIYPVFQAIGNSKEDFTY